MKKLALLILLATSVEAKFLWFGSSAPNVTVTVSMDGFQTLDGQPSASMEFKPL